MINYWRQFFIVSGGICALASVSAAAAADYDLVIAGGRVMDPESGFDQIANVGIRGGKIIEITGDPLRGRRVIGATGKVVAPGFIDLHAHGQHDVAQRFQALDGVTTAIDAESGAMPMAPYYRALKGRSIINFGVSASHGCARFEVFTGRSCGGHPAINPEAGQAMAVALSTGRDALVEPASPEQEAAILATLRRTVADGALGIGLGIEYTPGAGRREIYEVFKVAADIRAPVFVHVRQRPLDAAPGVPIAVVQEVIANAAATGAPLQVMHIQSTGLKDTSTLIHMIDGARRRGVDVTAEAYPYTAGSTLIGSEFFAPGWQERSGISYGDLQWTKTGERLTESSFNAYRKSAPGGHVIVHMTPTEAVDAAIASPDVLIASDGSAWETSGEHPRGAGTFARVLGRFVRERKLLDLMTALRKMTLLPAQRLEPIAPSMRNKGRIRHGADADIVVFDPATVIDRATYEKPMQASAGISHVLVAGELVVRDGRVVPGSYPGVAIKSHVPAAHP